MCHRDHPHTVTSPSGAGHANNVFHDATTQASRDRRDLRSGREEPGPRTGPAPTSTRRRTRALRELPREAHRRARQTDWPASFGASAHDFTSNSVGGTTYDGWSYSLHDGSFARNCTKCHASRVEGTTPGSSSAASVHYSADDVNLLAGTTNPAGTAANFSCYNCHGTTATPAIGAQGNRSGKDIQSKVIDATPTNQSGHPSIADTRHDSATEFAKATFGNALGVTAGTGQRHASCMDCHDPHEAKATSGSTRVTGSATSGNVAGPALQGAWGAKFGGTLAAWTAPTSANFTKTTITAGTDLEATLCFKCHTGYYWGTGTPPTSPTGGFAGTDVAKEFNPANVSFHPVLATPAKTWVRRATSPRLGPGRAS